MGDPDQESKPESVEEIFRANLDLLKKTNNSLLNVLEQVPALPAENRKLLRKRTASLNKLMVVAYKAEVTARTSALEFLRLYQEKGNDAFKHGLEFTERIANDFHRHSEVIHRLAGTLLEERTLFRSMTQARIATIAVIVALTVFSVAQFLDRFFPLP